MLSQWVNLLNRPIELFSSSYVQMYLCRYYVYMFVCICFMYMSVCSHISFCFQLCSKFDYIYEHSDTFSLSSLQFLSLFSFPLSLVLPLSSLLPRFSFSFPFLPLSFLFLCLPVFPIFLSLSLSLSLTLFLSRPSSLFFLLLLLYHFYFPFLSFYRPSSPTFLPQNRYTTYVVIERSLATILRYSHLPGTFSHKIGLFLFS